ncbi:hypothetical protein LCGC14_1629560 [marine sediment metagenome]|uniref:Uncharacterized protein n=1 Tax=marine sediment metagenome TaxID=412755 RepID=A0A0F9L2V1_9ZZZZ
MTYGLKGYTNASGIALPEVGMEAETFTAPLFKIGVSGTKVHIKTASVPLMQIYATSALTSGTVDLFKIDFTQTAAQQSGYIKGIRCTLTSNVKTPGSFNAIKGIIDYSTSGHAHGDAAPLASELTMPNSSAIRGTYSVIEAQIAVGASSSWQNAGPCAFFRCKLTGTKAQFDTRGYLFDIQGFTEGNDLFCDNGGTPAAADGGIRIRIGANDRYLLYADDAET